MSTHFKIYPDESVSVSNRFRRRLTILAGATALAVSSSSWALLPFEDTGNLYATMWTADVVRVFDASGNVVKDITAPGLDGPRGVAFNPHKGEVWVAGEHSNTIYIFNRGGHFKRSFTHPEFNEPIGITFKMAPDVKPKDQEVYIANSGNATKDPTKGNEIMVFDQDGNLLRKFTQPNLVDPNCAAFMPDGSYYLSNRLGGGLGTIGAIDKYDANDNFLFSFTTTGILSLMAVARDPNGPGDADDTIWATSGGGAKGIYEFDQNGNLLKSILPADIGDPTIVPQGIAFDDAGNFTVASTTNVIYRFDGDGNFLGSFPAGTGTARSIAFQDEANEDENSD